MVKVGDRLPEGSFRVKADDGTVKQVSTHELFEGQKVVLVGVPGAFTSTCHNAHIPTFVKNAAAIKAKGVDRIAVMAVNDHHVMKAWHEALKARRRRDRLRRRRLGRLHARVGLDNDMTESGMGIRAKRFAMIVDDGVVKTLAFEPPGGKIAVTGAEAVLGQTLHSAEPPAPGPYSFRAARFFGLNGAHAFAREFVGALVAVGAGVALHPVPGDVVARGRRRGFCQRSTFFTGLRSEVFQPFRFQPAIQPVTPPRTYCESGVEIDRPLALSAPTAPRSPPSAPCGCWWCQRAPPFSSLRWPFQASTAPQPPGPGLPEQAPSLQIETRPVSHASSP